MKRVFSLVFVLVLLCGMLTACDSESTKDSGITTTTATAVTGNGVTTTTASTIVETSAATSVTATTKTGTVTTVIDSAGNNDPNPTTTKTNEATKKPTTEKAPAKTTVRTTKPTAAKPTTRATYIDALEARYHADEVNGYSIWTGSNDYYCVDYNGFKTCSFPDDEYPLTEVRGGAFLTKETVSGVVIYRLRRASDGKILFTTENTDYAVAIPDINGKKMFADGYILVYSKKESYNGVTYQLGIVNHKGEWKQPLSATNPVLTKAGSLVTSTYFGNATYYCGEDILAFSDNQKYYFYNMAKNTVVEVKTCMTDYDMEVNVDRFDSMFGCGITFKNGRAVASMGVYRGYCKFFADGTTEWFDDGWHDTMHEILGTKYYDVANDRYICMGITYHEESLTIGDSNGNIIKKITNINVVDVNGFFENGTAQIVIKNKEGSYYYTMIDLKGNFLFEPIKIESNAVSTTDGHIVDNFQDGARLYQYTVVDKTGRVILTTDWMEYGHFGINNGVIRCKLNGKQQYKLVP